MIVRRSSAKGWPLLLLVVAANRESPIEPVVHRSAWRIDEHRALEGGRIGVVRGRDCSDSQEKLCPEIQTPPTIGTNTRAYQSLFTIFGPDTTRTPHSYMQSVLQSGSGGGWSKEDSIQATSVGSSLSGFVHCWNRCASAPSCARWICTRCSTPCCTCSRAAASGACFPKDSPSGSRCMRTSPNGARRARTA